MHVIPAVEANSETAGLIEITRECLPAAPGRSEVEGTEPAMIVQ